MVLSRWRVSELLARLGWRGRWIGKRLPAGRIAPALGADRRMWSVGADDVDQHITAVCEAGVNFGVERRPSAVKYDESSRNARLLTKEESRGFSRRGTVGRNAKTALHRRGRWRRQGRHRTGASSDQPENDHPSQCLHAITVQALWSERGVRSCG